MFKKSIVTICILFIVTNFSAFAQNKIYLDANWEETTADNASFYRILEKQKDGLFLMQDYYINGTLQMDGLVSDVMEETFEGPINWYNEQGFKYETRTYIKGVQNGDYTTYLHNGDILSIGTYKNDEPHNGLFSNSSIYAFSFSAYKDGKRTKDVSFYKNTNQKVKERYYTYDSKDIEYPTKDVFYDKNNKIIGTMLYSDTDYYQHTDGIAVSYYRENELIVALKTIKEYKNSQIFKSTTFDQKGKQIYEGLYKNGKPDNGYFLDYNALKNYVKGVIQAEVTFDDTLTILYQLTYKKGKPYDGTYKKYSTDVETYKSGKLTEKIEYYDSKKKNIKNKTVYSGDESVTEIFNETGELIGSSYTNSLGYKNGLEVDGNTRTFYENNKIVWVEKLDFTTNNKMLHCDYKDEKPYAGILLDYQGKEYYKDGNLEKKEYYRRNYENYENDTYYITKIEFFQKGKHFKTASYYKGKEYILELKDRQPFNGAEYRYSKITNYKNGKKDGVYSKFKKDKLIETGNYLDGSIDGLVTFYPNDKDKKTTCLFEKGSPINGTVSQPYEKMNYKNGKKTGECYTYYGNLVEMITYKDGIKEGNSIGNILSHNKVYKGVYKNDKMYSGSFFVMQGQTGNVETYINGKKHGKFIVKKPSIITEINYNKGEITSEKTKTNYNEEIGEGIYKKGKPYQGVFVKQEGNNAIIQITKFNKGKIVEETTENITSNREVIGKFTYKNGLKDGLYVNTNKDELPSFRDEISGIYKKGEPYQGEFISKSTKLLILSNYKKGDKDGVEYYETLYGKRDSLYYAKGKIIRGVQIEQVKSTYLEVFKHYYENGTRTKTINDNYEITYNTDNNNFTVTNQKIKAEVVFLDSAQTKGKIIYTEDNQQKGIFYFENGHLTKGKATINLIKTSEFVDIYIEIINNKIVTSLKPDSIFGMYYKVYSSTKISKKLNYLDYKNILKGFSFKSSGIGIVKQYTNKDVYLATMIMKDQKQTGTLITFKEKKGELIYKIKIKGKNKQTIKDLTYKQMLNEIEKLK